jgi:hypothetical protein
VFAYVVGQRTANWERAPASRFTAVCVVPPPAGIEPNSAPPKLAKPVATSSRFGLNGRSSVAANERETIKRRSQQNTDWAAATSCFKPACRRHH